MRITCEEAVKVATGQVGGNLGDRGPLDARYGTADHQTFHHIRCETDVMYRTRGVIGDLQTVAEAKPEDGVQNVVQAKRNQRAVEHPIDKPARFAAAETSRLKVSIPCCTEGQT